MQLTHEHDELSRSLKRFIDDEINPHVDEWERDGLFPAHDVFKKMGSLGFLGVNKPTKYGGLGLDFSYSAVMAETLGHINCGGIPMAIGVQTDMATPALARFGSDSLCEQFLAPSIAGDYVACLGVSEVGAGSDVASIKTVARSDGDDYLISGGKMWTTNGTQADWICLLANTGDGAPHKNKSLICVPLKENGKRTPGVEVARKLDKLGMHSSDTAELHFDEVRVPKSYRIGDEGAGFTYQMLQFQEERLYAALSTITGSERSIAETIDYTRERKAFGKSILENQVVYHKLAELQTEVEALRALVWKAVEIHISGGDCTKLASMAKLKGCRLSRQVHDSCLQYWGGMGYMSETPVARRYRDSRLGSIGGGADEIMIEIIAKYMGTLPPRTQ
ncbi:MAG: acyl-CoA dehydrogenase family protein [Pseudomonadota bacterium]